jgi:ABC-type sulfate/molybdate transport systems ATPase subunit
MTVFENVAFGLRARPRRLRPSRVAIRARVISCSSWCNSARSGSGCRTSCPAVQRQRIALARALAIEPRILLLDEPFGALDAKVRKELRRWLRQLHEEIHVTSVFVTHDQEEALELADRVVVLAKGTRQQIGTPEEVYEQPQSAFVHHFIGESLNVPVTIAAGGVHFAGRKLDLDPHGLSDGEASLFIRPYEVTVVPESGSALLSGIVKRVHGFGPARRLEIALREGDREHFIEVSAPRHEAVGMASMSDYGHEPIGCSPRPRIGRRACSGALADETAAPYSSRRSAIGTASTSCPCWSTTETSQPFQLRPGMTLPCLRSRASTIASSRAAAVPGRSIPSGFFTVSLPSVR